MTDHLSRRNFLRASTAAAALVAGQRLLGAAEQTAESEQDTGSRGLRFVHLTDIHVQPELRASEGLAKCLTAATQLNPRPDFILTSGDLVMDVFQQDEQRARQLFQLLKKVFDDSTDLPVYHGIGNHDVFAWGNEKVEETHPAYGKKLVSEYLQLPNRFYRFDQKGWRFFVLDDIQPAPERAYQAYIDEAQMAWLEEELRNKPHDMPAAVA